MPVVVVTDSAACLDGERAAALPLAVIPLHVYRDGVDIVDDSPADGPMSGASLNEAALAALRSRQVVTTSAPSVGELVQAYTALVVDGATELVSVHLSAALSSTYHHATLAAEQVAADYPQVRIEVVDSASVALGVGYAAIAGARAAAAGADVMTVATVASQAAAQARVFFGVTDLGYLKRSGRLSGASALVASSLSVKPILTVSGGTIQAHEKVRTHARLLSRLAELAMASMTELSTMGQVAVGVQHVAAEEAATSLADVLRQQMAASPMLADATVEIVPLSAAVAAHVGPGAVGCVVGAEQLPT